MISAQKKQMELLAPAGSLGSFFAALENGADAVFCGLKSFSARAKAKNFSLIELERVVGYTHKRNKRIYIALNTLIKESELQELIVVLSELDRLQVDGLIIQDLGLYHLAHTHFPGIPLHASTQMVVHNLAGVRQLERLGFERAVLARELSLAEINYIGTNCNLELEHFIHGALCYSMSGHCLFSSYIDGRSGNRGRCIQPCRRRYHHNRDSGFYFSTSDFSALEHIPALSRAGVVSLKIEGRMKSAEYVASVVSAYRIVLDAKKGNEKNAIAEAKEKLESAMGRKSSDGFLQGNGADIVLAKRKGGIGRIIGKVERLQGKNISFRLGDTIHVGDRLRIQPGTDRPGQGFTVRKLFLGKRAVKRAAKNTNVAIPLPIKGTVHVGDMVFKLATGKAFTLSEEACRRRLNAAPLHANAVRLRIDCNESSNSMTIKASVKSVSVKKTYQVEMIPANKTPLNSKILFKVFSHTGYKTLMLEDLQAGDLPRVVIKPSRLKEIRREFYTYFDALVEKEFLKQAQLNVKKIRDAILAPVASRRPHESGKLYIVTDHLSDLQIIKEYPDLHFVLPVTRQFLDEVQGFITDITWQQQVIWDLPSILFGKDWAVMQGMVRELLTMGFSRFRLNNIAHFEFFTKISNVHLIAGSWLYILNSQTVSSMRALGCNKYCHSIEDDKENIQMLQSRGHPEELLLTVYGAIDLFTSRIPAPVNEQECTLKNDKGEQLYLKESGGLTITRAEKPFSLIGSLKELREMACNNFVLDLRGIGFGTQAGQGIMNAFHEDRIIPGTVDLNFSRGLT